MGQGFFNGGVSMGVSTIWDREEAINDYIESYDNGKINRAELRDSIIEIAESNLEAIDILSFAGAL